MAESQPEQTKADQEETKIEASKEEEAAPQKTEKEKQIRDIIMNDLYNDLSSSDEEEESPADPPPDAEQEDQTTDVPKTTNATEPAKDGDENKEAKLISTKKKSDKNKGYTKEQMLRDAQDMEKKKIAREADEALRELYGDDYEEPNNPFSNQNPT